MANKIVGFYEVWITQDKRAILVSKMSDEHLSNCICRIQRSIDAGKPWRADALPRLLQEQFRRKEAGRYA